MNPNETPPKLKEFYLRAILEPDPADGQGWDVGFVWRVNWEMNALWWSIAEDGHWTLSRNIWELAPRDTKELDSGQLGASIESPVLLQAFVFGSQVACSLNRGPVIVAPIPEDREPGHVGILANAREEHLRPNGATPYQKLAVWPLDAVEFPDDFPDRPKERC